MSEFYNKIIKVQKELKAPKSQINNFGKYKYRNCEDILEAVKPLLVEEGLLLNIRDEIIMIGERFYVKATVKITDGETSLENTALAREPETKKGMDESQITGSSSSYARKYALNGMFCIDDNKDADSQDNSKEELKLKKSPDGNIDRKDFYEKVAKPVITEDFEKACLDSFSKLSNAIYDSHDIDELEKVRLDMEYRQDWNRLKKYKPEDLEELQHVFDEQKKMFMSMANTDENIDA